MTKWLRYWRTLSILLLFLGSLNSVQAQDSRDTHAKNFYLKVSPFSSLRLFNGPCINLTTEWRAKSTHSFQLDYTFYHDDLGTSSFESLSGLGLTFGWNKNGELREVNKRKDQLFYGLRLELFSQSFVREDTFTTTLPPVGPDQTDIYYGSRWCYGPHFVLGQKSKWKSGLLVEAFIGAGLKFNSVILDDLPWAIAEQRFFGDWPSPNNYLFMKGTHFLPVFKAGIQIGFGFSKKNK